MEKGKASSLFVNDGSFMERFKQLQEEKEKGAKIDDSTSGPGSQKQPKPVFSNSSSKFKQPKPDSSLKHKSKLVAPAVKLSEDESNTLGDEPTKRPKLDQNFVSGQSLKQVYVGNLLLSSNHQYRPPVMAVQAHAKRGFLQKNEVEVASLADMRFEAPLKIVMYPDPILRAKNKRVDIFDENLKKLVDEMFDVMNRTDGIGLSAPQVGINFQLMVFNPVGEGEEIVLVNPRVTRYSKKLAPFTEGCLSFPGINADVVRPEAVKVDAQDITGEKFSVSLSHLSSRVFQHEFDHLEGILFFDRMTAEVVDSIRAELLALEQKYEDRTGLSRPESVETRKRWKAASGFGRS